MALWTPYADDSALDLTKTTVKQEREVDLSPSFDRSPTGGYEYPSFPTLPVGHPAFFSGYQYPQREYAVPTAQMSPISGGSTCSYDTSAPPAPLSPHYTARTGPLSPPESPVSQASRRLHMDVDALSDDPDFQAFERDALRAMAEKNGGTLLGNNPRMRRAVRSTNQDSANDAYRKQRERNNFAAKQSRDRRKMREIHLALKVSYLKNEITNLKAKLASRVCGRCQQLCYC